MSDIDDILINQIEDRNERESTEAYINNLNTGWKGYLASHQGLNGSTADDLKAVTPTPEMLDLTREFYKKDANELARDRIEAKISSRSSVQGQSERSGGWSSPYYMLPEGAKELGDLIEHKNMNFNVGNIFKAAYRLGDKNGTTRMYDLEKMQWFIEREILREEKDGC